MNSKSKIVSVIFFLLLSDLSIAQSQINDSTAVPKVEGYSSPPFIRLGLGFGGSSITFGEVAFLECDLGKMFICLRICGAFNLPNQDNNESVGELGIVGGLPINYRLGYVTIGAGLSKVFYVTQQPKYPNGFGDPHAHVNIQKTTIGLPLQIEMFFTPVSFFGIGLNLFANVNSLSSFGGFAICIQIGRLR